MIRRQKRKAQHEAKRRKERALMKKLGPDSEAWNKRKAAKRWKETAKMQAASKRRQEQEDHDA